MQPKERRLPDLGFKLFIDRITSRQEISDGWYAHADRNLPFYRAMVPDLDVLLHGLFANNARPVGLDAGCGTGRAAYEIEQAFPGMEMHGITLVYHPPRDASPTLPRERMRIGHAGNPGFPDHSLDFVIAVGSLDTSDTIVEEGSRILPLLTDGGIFVFAPTVWYSMQRKDTDILAAHAAETGCSVTENVNGFGHPYVVFRAPASG